MRKQTRKAKLHQWRISQRRERRNRKKRRNRLTRKHFRVDWLRIQAPIVFDLYHKRYRGKLLAFLGKLRRFVVNERRAVTIDFALSDKMVSDGVLLFKAELTRILRIVGEESKLKCRPPKNPKVAQVLQRVGIYDLLRYRSHVQPEDDDVVCWLHSSGVGALGAKYEDVLGPLDEKISSSVQSGLYDGIVEAMTNANHHAYEMLRLDHLFHEDKQKEWWMFSQVRDGRLSVAFCDLGIGIPRSLPQKKKSLWVSLLQHLGSEPSDGRAIKAAVEESRSRTGQTYRGRGLKQLVAAIDKAQDGHLLIYSNKGRYSCRQKDDAREETFFDYKGSILGTLICWSLPLNPEAGGNDS